MSVLSVSSRSRDGRSRSRRRKDLACRPGNLPLLLMRRLQEQECKRTPQQVQVAMGGAEAATPKPAAQRAACSTAGGEARAQQPQGFLSMELQPQWSISEEEGVSVGDHRFLTVLGQGSFGRVYKSEDPLSGGFNAVKVLEKSRLLTYDDFRGVALECCMLNRLRHRNIVRLWGAVQACRNFYLFMEFAGQESLHKILQGRENHAGLALPEARVLFHQIADAVAYCHWQGVAHCDLKPQNIVLSDDGIPKIVDFGLALKLGFPIGTPRGTWPFTAPEAAWPCGQPWDLAKADVWSLGAVLLEMLCGADKLFRMLGWVSQTPLNVLRVTELIAFLSTPGALSSSLADDLGAISAAVAPMLNGMMYVVPVQRWSAKIVTAASQW
eukprot:TRINITY_DN50944_c0_g1_i1.p1 TRINITY_DN50944_c0_g1~~TRINITY_DN50944_c0_g1_i1.p1  ORF type:complete len:405 (-),score=84.91 TRINITY_DN50944_c0_g1_i1:40-1185(-)